MKNITLTKEQEKLFRESPEFNRCIQVLDISPDINTGIQVLFQACKIVEDQRFIVSEFMKSATGAQLDMVKSAIEYRKKCHTN